MTQQLLFTIIAALALIIIWQRWALRREFRRMAEAAERKKLHLVEKESLLPLRRQMDRLSRAMNDLVDQRRQSAALEQDHLRQVETTLRNIQEAILIVNNDNYVVMANDRVHALMGGQGDAVGQRVERVIPSADFLEFAREQRLSGGEAGDDPCEIELRIDGQSHWFEITSAKLPESGGATLSLYVLHEITRQKRLEGMRAEFVANVSHELRTPVTIIKGFVDTLVEEHMEIPEQDRERFLLKIQQNVIRLHRLLEDLLTLTRLESPSFDMRTEPCSLGDLVRDVTDNFQGRVEPGKLTLKAEIDLSPDYVEIDSLRITQVLENLLENAIRHSRSATELTVRTSVVGETVVCAVCDNGAGIPRSDLPHIFERFYRVDKGRSRDRGGTGLGLSIVKHIIQQHGGSVRAESEEGQGASIIFELPLAPDPGSAVEEKPFEKPSLSEPTAKLIEKAIEREKKK